MLVLGRYVFSARCRIVGRLASLWSGLLIAFKGINYRRGGANDESISPCANSFFQEIRRTASA